MRSVKLGIVVCKKASQWKSCNSISQNLIQAYKLAGRSPKMQIKWFLAEESVGQVEIAPDPRAALSVAKKILDSGIDELVFLDHHVDPLALLVAMRSLNLRRTREMRYSFHIYGDFSLNSWRWLQVGKLLRGQKVRLVCASERQQKLVSFFEPPGDSQTTVCPFAVNTRFFSFNRAKRDEMRAKLGVSNDEKLLIYTGRISLQKCVDRLVEEFVNFSTQSDKKLRLAIAGPIDDIAGMTSGIRIPDGFYFHQFENLLARIPFEVRKNIFILGELNAEKLTSLYSAGDAFVSLSLYHDEDFGMAPAEALSSGLPAVLTEWGGYASFKGENVPSSFVPVRLDVRGLNLDSQTVGRLVDEALNLKVNRKAVGLAFAKIFGIEGVSRRLRQIYFSDVEKSFAGFSWPLEVVREKEGQMTGELYKEVYERYVQ